MPTSDGPYVIDLPIRGADGLSEERKSSIRQALQQYRDQVLEQNMSELVKAIDEIDSAPPKVTIGQRYTEDEIPELRIQNLFDKHGIYFDPPDPTVATVRDFLSDDRRENLIRSCRLDGISHGEVDLAARNAWIDDVERRMSTAERAVVHPNGLPADLKYLTTVVRGLCGPGLPRFRSSNQLKFLSDLDEDENRSIGGGTEAGWITVPNTEEEVERGELGNLPEWWGDCKVAMAVGIGQRSFAAYCREQEDDNSDDYDGERNGEWGWKFGQQDMPSQSELYDTVEAFLEWYAMWSSD